MLKPKHYDDDDDDHQSGERIRPDVLPQKLFPLIPLENTVDNSSRFRENPHIRSLREKSAKKLFFSNHFMQTLFLENQEKNSLLKQVLNS